MKKLSLLVPFLLIPFFSSFAEDNQTPPSFDEMSTWNHRHPDTDINIDLYKKNWRDSDISIGFGGFLIRHILTQGDPINPPKAGAVLKYMKAYDHGTLEAGCTTQPVKSDNQQYFFFITKGEGKIEAGKKTEVITEGSGVFVPAKLQFKFINTSDTPLDAVIVTEDIPADFEPQKDISVGNYHNNQPGSGMHWAHIGRGILGGAKFYNPVGFAAVSIDAFDIAQPHVHNEGTEEVWYQVKGNSLLLFGNRLRWQHEGEAFLIPPDGKVPHASINQSDEPMLWLYMGNRHDKKK